MAYSKKVNIQYSITVIVKFKKSIEESIDKLEEIRSNIEKSYGEAEKYIDANLENAEKCLRQNAEEERVAGEVIREIEERIPKYKKYLESTKTQVNKIKESVGPLYDQYRDCAKQQTRINHSPPKKSDEGPESDEAYKQAKKAWAREKDMAQKAVDDSYRAYSQAKNAVEEGQRKIERLEHCIRTLEDYLCEMQQILNRIVAERSRLQEEQRRYQRLKSALWDAYNSFFAEYSRASQTLKEVLERAERAHGFARRINYTLSGLSRKNLGVDDRVYFTSISEVSKNAFKMKESAEISGRKLQDIKKASYNYNQQVVDGIMNESAAKLREIVAEQQQIVNYADTVADRLEELAYELQEYYEV